MQRTCDSTTTRPGRGRSFPPHRCDRRGGFTLLELVAVIVIISALAAIVIPLYRNFVITSKFTQLAESVQRVQSVIGVVSAENGGPPSVVDESLLGELPSHPWDPDHPSPIWNDGSAAANQTHPANKRISPAGAFWYNPANGTFRALVQPNGAPAQIQHYNRANGTEITDAGATQ